MPKLSDAVRSGALTGNVLAQDCPSRNILKHVTSRWAVLTLIALQGRTIRFAALRRMIGGVSDRMLTQTLQTLEADGFVHRRAFDVVPPHVEYCLTPLGQDVAQHVRGLADWIEDNLHQILVARPEETLQSADREA
ncbi:transcriptional regulator [Thioclava dalianensis]|uniref:Transcriptional regulator n=1 Tax=Thioclava dalianensis TaxID=1185766 RepID=A0A074TRK5_9RHOB|nr:helix-turn-helix domain-containing protein [Thioclava dalianensis]KEP71608.1 transcriptional regulator [Thioclava dalianensis]SFN43289.1 transcriptional regulator, HxlR family [Thioclava dalianensis]